MTKVIWIVDGSQVSEQVAAESAVYGLHMPAGMVVGDFVFAHAGVFSYVEMKL